MATEETTETSTTTEVDQEAISLPTEEKFRVVVPETQLGVTIQAAWVVPKKKCMVARASEVTAAAGIAAVVETRVAATVVMTVVGTVTEIAVAMIEVEVAIVVDTVVVDSYKDHVCQQSPKVRPLSCNQIISDSVPKIKKDSFLSTNSILVLIPILLKQEWAQLET